MRITILGGHGRVALLLARRLRDAGHEVAGVIRNPEHAPDLVEAGADPVVADLETLDVAGIAGLFTGADAVVWSAGAGGGSPERTRAVDQDAAIRSYAAATAAGVDRYVMVSYLGARPDHGVDPASSFFAYAEAKAAADAALRATDLDWTIVAPGTLSDDAATGGIALVAQGAEPPRPDVPRDDVAAVVAAVLITDAAHRGTIGFVAGATPIAEAVAG